MGITVIAYEVQDIGKHVKKSKRRFYWRFSIDGQEHYVELSVSYLSGKKKVSLDDRSLYEGQKVMSTSFQFPFSIGPNMCNIVQHGEHFELRINNQVFSHLYDQVKMKREFVYEGDSGYNKGGDEDSYKPKETNSYSSSYKGYGSESNRGQGGSNYQGYSSGSYKGYGSENQNKEREESPSTQTYSRSKGWDDVKKAQNKAKETKIFSNNQREDDDPGFSKDFEKFGFDEKPSKKKEDPFDSYKNKYSSDRETTKPTVVKSSGGGFDDAFEGFSSSNTNSKKADAFEGFGGVSKNTSAPNKSSNSGFDGFGDFGTTQPKKQTSGFDGFGDFSGFSGPSQQNSAPKTSTVKTSDLLGLDFGSGPSTSNNSGGFDAFSGPSQTTTKPVNNSDLLGLDFSGPSTTNTSNSNFTTKTTSQGGDLLGGDLFGSTTQQQNVNKSQQVQQQQTSINLGTSQQTTTQSKPDPWANLISLDANELNSTKNTQPQQQGGFNNNGYNSYGGNQMGGFGGNNFNTNQQFGGYGTNNTSGGFGGNNFNTGYGNNLSSGGFGGSQGGFGGNFGGSQGGYGGMQGNNNFGGNNFGGYGGNTGGSNLNGGFGGNTGGFGGNGFQSNTNTNKPTQQTPFDF